MCINSRSTGNIHDTAGKNVHITGSLIIKNRIGVYDIKAFSFNCYTEVFRANIIDVSPEGLIIELTGNQDKVDAFLSLLEGYEILELARTGIAGLRRGTEDIVYLDLDSE